jgi:hypothetical protein
MSMKAHCVRCKNEVENETRIKYKNRYYCPECYKVMEEEKKENKSTDSQQYRDLVAYICTTFNLEAPTGMILKQIQNYKKAYNYNYAGQAYTIWYCKEILNNFNKEQLMLYGIYVVKKYYDDAKNYYNKQEEQKAKMKEINYSEINSKVVKSNKTIIKSNSKSDTRGLLDLNSLV